jgi:hypothetical protein
VSAGEQKPIETNCLRILFAGGCHVSGYPLAPGHGFPSVTLTRLQPEASCRIRTLDKVNLKRTDMIVDECVRFPPDILVLQLGHYESGVWIGKRVRRLFKVAKRDSTQERSSEHSLGTQPFSKVRSLARIIANRLLTFAGEPPYELVNFPTDLDRCFAQIQSIGIPMVLVLSPFPCPDYIAQARRRQMDSAFTRLSSKYAFHYLDVTNDLRHPDLYADAFHLGANGHKRLAELLTGLILEFHRQRVHA